MLPQYYEFYAPVKIVAGNKALESIPYELSQLSAHRPLIITDAGIRKAGLLQTVLNAFRNSDIVIGAVFDQTPPDSSFDTVNQLATLFKEQNCDSLIAIGGGSCIDTAKGVNMLLSENIDDIRQCMGVDRLKNPQKPLLVVPTTAGTGSEVTLVTVIVDPQEKRKYLFTSPYLLPRVAVLDPRMTLSLPPLLTAATGMDALTHAVEAYTCNMKNPVSDAYALSALNLIRENLARVVKKGNDRKARFAMANASLLAGIAFSNSMVGGVHSIGHACGSVAGLHHGIAMAILLPWVMEFNMDKIADLYGELLLPLSGADTYARTPEAERPEQALSAVRNLNLTLNDFAGLPLSLSQAGVKKAQLEQIAATALDDASLVSNPKDMSYDEIMRLLLDAF